MRASASVATIRSTWRAPRKTGWSVRGRSATANRIGPNAATVAAVPITSASGPSAGIRAASPSAISWGSRRVRSPASSASAASARNASLISLRQ